MHANLRSTADLSNCSSLSDFSVQRDLQTEISRPQFNALRYQIEPMIFRQLRHRPGWDSWIENLPERCHPRSVRREPGRQTPFELSHARDPTGSPLCGPCDPFRRVSTNPFCLFCHSFHTSRFLETDSYRRLASSTKETLYKAADIEGEADESTLREALHGWGCGSDTHCPRWDRELRDVGDVESVDALNISQHFSGPPKIEVSRRGSQRQTEGNARDLENLFHSKWALRIHRTDVGRKEQYRVNEKITSLLFVCICCRRGRGSNFDGYIIRDSDAAHNDSSSHIIVIKRVDLG